MAYIQTELGNYVTDVKFSKGSVLQLYSVSNELQLILLVLPPGLVIPTIKFPIPNDGLKQKKVFAFVKMKISRKHIEKHLTRNNSSIFAVTNQGTLEPEYILPAQGPTTSVTKPYSRHMIHSSKEALNTLLSYGRS